MYSHSGPANNLKKKKLNNKKLSKEYKLLLLAYY